MRANESHTSFKNELKDWINGYHFSYFATLSSLNRCKYTSYIDSKVRKWVKTLERLAMIEAAYIGVYNKIPYPHAHLLLTCNCCQNNSLFGLNDNNLGKLKRAWAGSVDIKPIYDQEGAVGYLIDQNTPYNAYQLLTPYNINLLMESARQDALNQ